MDDAGQSHGNPEVLGIEHLSCEYADTEQKEDLDAANPADVGRGVVVEEQLDVERFKYTEA
jgi:hypothetical protein